MERHIFETADYDTHVLKLFFTISGEINPFTLHD